MSYVVSFEHLRMTDVDSVGGKNASLGEMISQLADAGGNPVRIGRPAKLALVEPGDVGPRRERPHLQRRPAGRLRVSAAAATVVFEAIRQRGRI